MKKQSLELAISIKNSLEQLVSSEKDAPQIEIDIIKEKIRQLYDNLNSFDSISKPETKAVQAEYIDNEINELLDEASQMFAEEKEKQIIEQETVLEEQVIEDNIEPEIPDETTITKVHEEIEEKIEVENKEKVEATKEDKPKIEKPKSKSKTKLKVNIEPEKPMEPLSEKKVYVLDVEAEEETEDEEFINPSINLKPIKSLKTGIGINDKFMFINDLFEGNARQYNKSIKKLDSVGSLKEALYLLGDMKDENIWESDDNVYRQFKVYIERRFL